MISIACVYSKYIAPCYMMVFWAKTGLQYFPTIILLQVLKYYRHHACILKFCSIDAQLNITLLSEQFEPDVVVVIMEWAHQNFYSYNVSIVPQLATKYNDDETRALLSVNVSYNTFYHTNVTAYPPCGQRSLSNIIELFYSEYYFYFSIHASIYPL